VPGEEQAAGLQQGRVGDDQTDRGAEGTPFDGGRGAGPDRRAHHDAPEVESVEPPEDEVRPPEDEVDDEVDDVDEELSEELLLDEDGSVPVLVLVLVLVLLLVVVDATLVSACIVPIS